MQTIKPGQGYEKREWEDGRKVEFKELYVNGILNSSAFSPELLSTEDVSGAEEGDAREPQVLMQHEHSHWDEVGVTQVVDEAADVAVVACIDTIHFPILYRKHNTYCKWSQLTLDAVFL